MYTVIIQISNNFKVQLDLYDPFSVEQALSCVSKQLYARILAGLSIRALKCWFFILRNKKMPTDRFLFSDQMWLDTANVERWIQLEVGTF